MAQDPDAWRVVLVRPRNPLNIGAAARAMANFGFSSLVVVEPYEAAWRETRSAVGAEAVIQAAKVAGSLAEAVDRDEMVIATTSGQRRALNRELLSLDEFSQWLAARATAGSKALLFGSEKTGLSNEHLSYCHALVRIPTAAHCPSMNLGQAVAVCCYELVRGLRNGEPVSSFGRQQHAEREGEFSPSPPAGMQSLEHIFERATRVLDQAGYLKPKSRQATLIKLRLMLVERGLSSYDARILGGILAQIEWKFQNP
jgi:TrmH family RNA methyltransferase